MALRGLKVVEMAGLAPVPFAGMILADFGASVVRVDRPGQPSWDTLTRGKRSLCVSLKEPAGLDVVKRLCSGSDVLIEPYRPGVMEKLGIGPETLCRLNPRLIYARLTGFGQTGSLSRRAGHDINYLAISGVLSALGRSDSSPHPPANLLADFAGGGLTCVMGILVALLERSQSGKGQVIDSAMTEGVAYLSSFLTTSRSQGIWSQPRGMNMLDGGAPFYDCYKTSDGKYVSVGAIEPQFYDDLLKGLEVDPNSIPSQMEIEKWPETKEKFAKIFATKTQQQWVDIFSKLDACVEPVLTLNEAPSHPHNKERTSHLQDNEGSFVAGPAPKLSRTPAVVATMAWPEIGQHSVEVLREMGYSQQEVEKLLAEGVVYQHRESNKL